MRAGLVLPILIASGAAAQPPAPDGMRTEWCTGLNQQVLIRVANGRSPEAEQLLSKAINQGDRLERICAGLTLRDVAALLLISGRPAEAEVAAARSVRTLEAVYSPTDPALLRPLQMLATVRFEEGKTAQARQAFEKMQAIPVRRAEDRGLVSAMSASLLEAEGRWPEAESQYLAAIGSLNGIGGGDTADAAALLNGLGGLYIKERRLSEACQMLDRALAIFERAPDADPWDRVKLLYTKGTLRTRQHQWSEAEQDLAGAVSIADRESRAEPIVLRPLLIAYANVLRKNHRRSEARSIGRRIAALGSVTGTSGLVDVADLRAAQKHR